MKCYVHIGSPKTGTSSIQSFLSLNKNLLFKHNYCIDFFGYPQNFTTAFYCKEHYDEDPFLAYSNIYSEYDLQQFKKLYFELFKKRYTQENVQKVVISSEFLEDLSQNIKQVNNLKNLLTDLGFDEYKIIYYIREQGEIMNSSISQSVKSGGRFITEAEIPIKAKHYEYKQKIQMFEEVFGRENMDVRIFEKEIFKNGSIIEDFLDAIDFSGSLEDFFIPENKNESLSYSGIQILNEYNKIEIDTKKKQIDENRIIFMRIISKYFTTPKYQMPIEIYQEIQNNFKSSNEWIRKNYFPHRKNLFTIKEYSPLPQPKIEEDVLKSVVKSFIELSKVSVLNLKTFIKRLDKNKKYILYGYTEVAKAVLDYFPHENIYIVDGVKFDTKEIKHPDELTSLQYEKIIVTVVGREKEIIQELVKKYNLLEDDFLTLDPI